MKEKGNLSIILDIEKESDCSQIVNPIATGTPRTVF